MTDYVVYKMERFNPDTVNHVGNQVKYWCEVIPSEDAIDVAVPIKHPYTDENLHRLIGQIASLYRKGDRIRTISEAAICDGFDGKQVELKEPLNHDELRILAIQVLEELRKK